MKIESDIVKLNVTADKVFNFLSDFNNYEPLFPQEKVKNWKSSEKDCSFLIKGMSVINMEIKRLSPETKVEIASGREAPFKFNIQIDVEYSEELGQTAVQLTFEADVNSFMKMMIERPLSNFFNTMVNNLPQEVN